MAEHIELEEVVLHAVVFKVGRDRVGVLRVGGVLHGGKILDVQIVRHDDQAARVLPRRAALRQAVHLGVAGRQAALLEILAHEAEGRLVREGTDRARAEHLRLAEHLDGVAVGARLILTRKVQVDIGHLAAAVAEERLERNVEPVLDVLRPALRADLIRHIRAAAVAAVGDELRVLALRAAVVRREGVDLRDAGHIRHERRANRPSRADEIAVFKAALHELLRGHIDDVVLAEDAPELDVQAVDHQLRRILAVERVALVPDESVQILLGVLQPRREQLPRRQKLDLLDEVGDVARVVDDDLVRLLLPEVGKLPHHLVGRLEVDRQRRIRVRELLAREQDMAVDLVLRFLEVDVARRADGFAQLFAETHDRAVKLAQLLLGLHVAVSQHEGVVAQGLDLQIVVKRRDAPQLGPVLVVGDGAEQLARLAGRADNQPLAVRDELRLRDDRHALEVFQV